MAQPQVIFLFDIDSVLVEPLGYRAAVQETLRYFLRKLGLNEEWVPDENAIALFEANRISSEWDMVPISLAAIFDHILAHHPGLQLPAKLSQAHPPLDSLNQASLPDEIDFSSPIARIGAAVQPGIYPAKTALQLARRGTPPASATAPSEDPSAGLLFPRLARHPILDDLFSETRDILKAATTRIFQHFSLGSEAFAQTYRLQPEIQTPSMLRERDLSLLDPTLCRELLSHHEHREIMLAAYTLRPSLPPREAPEAPYGYAPEAELALEITGLSPIPLIGYGRIRFLALQLAVEPEKFVKPSPVQALAAIFAALSGNEIEALQAAFHLASPPPGRQAQKDPLIAFLSAAAPLSIHVFEDSPGGIEAVRQAGQILSQHGIPAAVHSWGIARHPEKVSALRRIGVSVSESTTTAVKQALSTILH